MDEELDWPDEELDWANELCDGARRGRLSYVEELLDWGADVDARDDRNVTPLHYAVFYRHTAVVDLLCERGADVDAAVCGTTALHLTADVMMGIVTEGGLNLPQPRERETARCAELLIAAGAEVDAEYERKTPLALALKSGHRRLVKILLEAGANARLAAASRPFLLRDREPWKAALRLYDAVAAAGSWKLYVVEHRRALAGVVCACARVPFPLDAAGNVVEFLYPPGGH